jgi:hypothetical protein
MPLAEPSGQRTTLSHYQHEFRDSMLMWSPGISEDDVAIVNLLHCCLLNDLISNDNPISDVIIDFATECILRL